jgi:hypothetical protein
MKQTFMALLVCSITCVALAGGCSDSTAPPSPPCDEACRDQVAVRSMRETMKLIFNLTLQGKPVGTHDETIPCLKGGKARVFGEATSNAVQGSTEVRLTYELDHCSYTQKDAQPSQTYDVIVTGTIRQEGTIAVQPSATTALIMKSDSISVSGTVYDPPNPYEGNACLVDLAQNGGRLSGTFCGRTVSFPL